MNRWIYSEIIFTFTFFTFITKLFNVNINFFKIILLITDYIASDLASYSGESSSGEMYLMDLYSFFGLVKNSSINELWYLTFISLSVLIFYKKNLK